MSTRLKTCLTLLLLLSASTANGQSATGLAAKAQAAIERGDFPGWLSPQLPQEIEQNISSKANWLASQLELDNDAKSQAVVKLVEVHFGRVWAWHQQVDTRLDAAWNRWDDARDNSNGKTKDELKALLIWTEQIEPIYAEFAPQIELFISAMVTEVGEQKATQLQDIITRSPGAKRTYDAYLAMVPEMREDEKQILWNRMVCARRDALAAWTDKQIVKLFKLYKIRNELSIDHFGYDYQKRYKTWASSLSK